MKIVRLKSADLRRWRQNKNYLVDDSGMLVGEVSEPLERALAQVTRSARSQRKSLDQRISIGAGPKPPTHLIQIVVTRTGISDSDIAVEQNIDGHRVVTSREVMAAEMIAEHGECQLRAPNGVILKVLRDPGIRRPTLKESQQIAPHPEHCPCKAWGKPHPGTHYPTCEWNRLAPPGERAPSNAIPEEEIRMLPTEALAALQRRPIVAAATSPIAARVAPSVVAEAPPLDAPETCRNGCLSWATPKGFPIPAGQHHPTCAFAKPWAIKTTREAVRILVDLRTGERVRHATRDETGQADVAAQKTGSPIIHIDDVPYAIVLESELDAEEREPLPVAAAIDDGGAAAHGAALSEAS